VEAVGGAIGGYLGGIMPDLLEPAISSWHRGTAHSYAGGATVVAAATSVLAQWESVCRTNAENCKAILMIRGADGQFALASPFRQFMLSLGELFWRLMAGLLNGFVAGYISHVALDAGTPRSIPLLINGF